MVSSIEQKLANLLKSDRFKDSFFPYLSTEDICNIRATSSSNCDLVTKRLFTRIHVSFSANTFTKRTRLTALSRIGHHIKHLTFYLPHSGATFLPPLIHPSTGDEISFRYTPHTSAGSVLSTPKYANEELGNIMIQQYPPLFHAATNVPSFINALRSLPNMRHLTIRCPGQKPEERYRSSIVDYALISLRIAVERATLKKLSKLSLSPLHLSAFNHLRHVLGLGCVPSASRRWRQIRKVYISVEAWDFYGTSPGIDHLKVLDDYIRSFSSSLEKLSFTWIGRRGPCPVALSADPLLAPPKSSRKLFLEVTSPMSPLPTKPMRRPMYFPKLLYLQICNAAMNAPQLKELITMHRGTVKEYNFENVVLVDRCTRGSLSCDHSSLRVFDDSSESPPIPSAAVKTAKELLDVGLGGCSFSDEERSVIKGSTTTPKRRRVCRRRGILDSIELQIPKEPAPLTMHAMKPSRSDHRSSKASILSETTRSPIPASVANAPILSPCPVLLQPTVYSPIARHNQAPSSVSGDGGMSSVQRNIELNEARRRLVGDATARTSAFENAKAAIRTRFGRQLHTERAAGGVDACRLMAVREFGGCSVEVLEDRSG